MTPQFGINKMKNKVSQGVYKSPLLTGKVRLQQNEFFLNNLENIILSINPHRIIEIGTARGGTTLAISDILIKNNLHDSKIKTFDISSRHHLKNLSVSNIEFYVGNIFDWPKSELSKPEEITNFLSENKTNLILCDGANKIKEFNILSQYLKTNDLIMAHDYAPNKEVFESDYVGKIWNHMEICDKDIQNTVETCNLETYNNKLINQTAWVAKIKK
jgi:cephalosporin hydroxylase